jgi:hypothetical protein
VGTGAGAGFGELSVAITAAVTGSATADGSVPPFWIDSRGARFALISLILFLA